MTDNFSDAPTSRNPGGSDRRTMLGGMTALVGGSLLGGAAGLVLPSSAASAASLSDRAIAPYNGRFYGCMIAADMHGNTFIGKGKAVAQRFLAEATGSIASFNFDLRHDGPPPSNHPNPNEDGYHSDGMGGNVTVSLRQDLGGKPNMAPSGLIAKTKPNNGESTPLGPPPAIRDLDLHLPGRRQGRHPVSPGVHQLPSDRLRLHQCPFLLPSGFRHHAQWAPWPILSLSLGEPVPLQERSLGQPDPDAVHQLQLHQWRAHRRRRGWRLRRDRARRRRQPAGTAGLHGDRPVLYVQGAVVSCLGSQERRRADRPPGERRRQGTLRKGRALQVIAHRRSLRDHHPLDPDRPARAVEAPGRQGVQPGLLRQARSASMPCATARRTASSRATPGRTARPSSASTAARPGEAGPSRPGIPPSTAATCACRPASSWSRTHQDI